MDITFSIKDDLTTMKQYNYDTVTKYGTLYTEDFDTGIGLYKV